MKNGWIAAILALFVVAGLSAEIGDILAQTTTVEFVNDTGYDIYHLFFSPADSEYWGPDIFDSTTVLETGQSREFLVHHPDRCNAFDFMAIDEDNDAYYIYETVVCDDQHNVIELTLEDYSDESAPDFDLVEAGFVNDTPYEMWLVFISPSDSSYFGVDFLGSSTILGTGEGVYMYVPAGSTEIVYDIITFDQDGDQYVFQVGIDNSTDSMTWPIEMSDLQ
ncbi:MAG: hypothetical protein ACLFR8_02240 [Alkalispirochaeta sp.]